jgi:peptidoglycan/LPS O-acetylase OafA/YrhL
MLFYLCVAIGLAFSQKQHLKIAVTALVIIYLVLGVCLDSPLLNGFYGNTKIFEFILGILAFKIHGSLKKTPPLICASIAILCLVCMIINEVGQTKVNSLLSFGLPSFILILSTLGLEPWLQKQGTCKRDHHYW